MGDQAPRRLAAAAPGEARSVARPCGPTLVWPTATHEPQGYCHDGANVLQRGIVWIFQRCGALSPRAALLVIASVMLWVPLSAAISIGMHAVLLANAVSLPAWMQLLHPVAAVIAKSKVLVLAACPAAWPQAKKHAWVQTVFWWVHRMVELDSMRKTAHRYQQTKQAFAQSGDVGVGFKYVKSRHRHWPE